jgi:hypothetical protein
MRLAEIQAQAHFHNQIIHGIQYQFEIEDDKGWRARAGFYAEGARFRIDLEEVTGRWVVDRRLGPGHAMVAYNGERYQSYSSSDSLLQLKDGNRDARYPVPTPHTMLHSWIRLPDALYYSRIVRSRTRIPSSQDRQSCRAKRTDFNAHGSPSFP